MPWLAFARAVKVQQLGRRGSTARAQSRRRVVPEDDRVVEGFDPAQIN